MVIFDGIARIQNLFAAVEQFISVKEGHIIHKRKHGKTRNQMTGKDSTEPVL